MTAPTPEDLRKAERCAGPHEHKSDHRRTCATWIYGQPESACDCPRRGRVTAIARALVAERENALDDAAKKSVCTYCGHVTEDPDAEARFVSMAAHIMECPSHPLKRMAEECEKAHAAGKAEGYCAGVEDAAKRVEDYGHSNGRIRASHKHMARAVRALLQDKGGAPE